MLDFTQLTHITSAPSDTLQLGILSFILGNILRASIKPNKTEAKLLGNALAFIIMALIRLIRYYSKEHKEAMSTYLDRVYSKVFHAKNHREQEAIKKLIVG